MEKNTVKSCESVTRVLEILLDNAIIIEGGAYDEYRITAEDYEAAVVALLAERENTENS